MTYELFVFLLLSSLSDDTFNLGLKFELVVEVRPRVASGVLLHVYTAVEEYLTMYIHRGTVRQATDTSCMSTQVGVLSPSLIGCHRGRCFLLPGGSVGEQRNERVLHPGVSQSGVV